MAFTVGAYDVPAARDWDGHGDGINAASCVIDFGATRVDAGFEYRSVSQTSFSDNRHGTDRPNLIPNNTRQGVVFA